MSIILPAAMAAAAAIGLNLLPSAWLLWLAALVCAACLLWAREG